MVNVVGLVGRIAMANAIQTLLAVSFIKLFKNDVTPNVTTLIGDLEVADFTGYVEQTVTAWGEPYLDAINGGVSLTAPSHQFVTTDPTTVPNTIYGYWVEDATGKLIQCGRFDDPIPMGFPNDAIPLMVTLNMMA